MHTRNAIALSFAIIFFWGQNSFAQMQSDNYHITASVLSSGGRQISSLNYQTNPTISQPSPLMDGYKNPASENYDNYPGFWYTVQSEIIVPCDGDFVPDGDVDGSDLSEYIFYAIEIDLGDFAAEFGRIDCPVSQ